MSHIPSHVMPHAKPHDAPEHHDAPKDLPTPPPVPPSPRREAKPFPWAAAAIGGVVAVGAAVTAAVMAGKPNRPKRKKNGTSRKPRGRKADAA